MNAIEINGLTKSFQKKPVLEAIDLVIPKGTIFGLVGENGAGKTTLMKLLVGLERADCGTIFINQEQVHYGETKTNRFTGYLPDVPAFYSYMKAPEYLQLCAQITGIPKAEREQKVKEMLAKVGLAEAKNKIGGFSRGMKQRLGIAQALLNNPEILICDEPTSALDPTGRHDFLALLQSLKKDMTILFSTHILSDVERICDHVGILHQQKIVAYGTLDQLKATYMTPKIRLEWESEKIMQSWYETIKKLTEITMIQTENSRTMTLFYQGSYQKVAYQLSSLFVEQKIAPLRFEAIEPTLDEIFLEVTK